MFLWRLLCATYLEKEQKDKDKSVPFLTMIDCVQCVLIVLI